MCMWSCMCRLVPSVSCSTHGCILREKKVRQLNRQRSKEKRLRYRSKYNLAREMLLELDALLPAGSQVYVLFNSWYASAKLINLCLRKHWQVICALKSNRKIEKQRIDGYNQTLKHKPYQKITLEAVGDRRAPSYHVRTVSGHLKKVPQEVYVILPKNALGIPAPSTSSVQTPASRLRKP